MLGWICLCGFFQRRKHGWWWDTMSWFLARVDYQWWSMSQTPKKFFKPSFNYFDAPLQHWPVENLSHRMILGRQCPVWIIFFTLMVTNAWAINIKLYFSLSSHIFIMLRSHMHEYGHVQNRHVMFITTEHIKNRNLKNT